MNLSLLLIQFYINDWTGYLQHQTNHGLRRKIKKNLTGVDFKLRIQKTKLYVQLCKRLMRVFPVKILIELIVRYSSLLSHSRGFLTKAGVRFLGKKKKQMDGFQAALIKIHDLLRLHNSNLYIVQSYSVLFSLKRRQNSNANDVTLTSTLLTLWESQLTKALHTN